MIYVHMYVGVSNVEIPPSEAKRATWATWACIMGIMHGTWMCGGGCYYSYE